MKSRKNTAADPRRDSGAMPPHAHGAPEEEEEVGPFPRHRGKLLAPNARSRHTQVIVVRTDGPPFIGKLPAGCAAACMSHSVTRLVSLSCARPQGKARAGLRGRFQQGPGAPRAGQGAYARIARCCWRTQIVTPGMCVTLVQITHSDFTRDLALINKEYIPTAHKSYQYLRAGTWILMLTFFVLILVRKTVSGARARPCSVHLFVLADRHRRSL